MGVSAVVVTYNRLSLLKECLKHLLNQYYDLDYIFVMNNDSTDGTKQYLDNLNNDKIVVKNLSKNVGGAGGFSLGTKAAYQESDSDYFWLMDDDTMPTINALSQLVKFTHKLHNIGFLCSKVEWWKDHESVNVPTVSKKWTELLPNINAIRVDKASFVSLLVSRKAVKVVGLPIKDMFIWGDDYEYTSRITNYGFNSYFIPSSLIIHKSVANDTDETVFNTNRLNYYKYMYRNFMFDDRKYGSRRCFIKDIIENIFISIKALFTSKNHRFKRFLCVLISTFKGIFFNPNIEYPK